MKKIFLLIPMLLALAPAAQAGAFDSVDERVTRLEDQLKDRHDYQAELARNLASIAQDELAQHDLNAARQFMELAEQAAAKGGQ